MKRAVIVAGGNAEKAFCLAYMEKYPFEYKTAVDAGLQFFYDTKQVPDLIAGDFDSVDQRVLSWFEKQEEIKWLRLIPEKDDTDTEAALREIIRKGYDEIHILGGIGSRMDHTMGNIGLLGIGLKMGVRIFLADSHNRIRMITEGITISRKEQYGDYISLLPFTPQVTGITLTGMKYPLRDYTMVCHTTIGISNEIIEEEGKISLKDGILLVFETRDSGMGNSYFGIQ